MKTAVIFAGVMLIVGAASAQAASTALFNEYVSNVQSDVPTVPDLSTPELYNYRTRIREGARLPANFGGHFNLIEWGCGTDCSAGAIVEKFTGHVIMLPVAYSYLNSEAGLDAGYEFYKNSLILGLHGQIGSDNRTKSGDYYFALRDNQLQLITFVPMKTPEQAQSEQQKTPIINNNAADSPQVVKPSAIPSQPPSVVAVTETPKPVSPRKLDKDDIGSVVSVYAENEIKFSRDYKGRLFEDTLPFFKATKGFSAGYRVSFGGGIVNGDVECNFISESDLERMAEWKKGQNIHISGVVNDVSFGTINLADCNAQTAK